MYSRIRETTSHLSLALQHHHATRTLQFAQFRTLIRKGFSFLSSLNCLDYFESGSHLANSIDPFTLFPFKMQFYCR